MFNPVIVVIPNTPYPELYANAIRRQSHWSQRTPQIAEAKREGMLEARQQLGEFAPIPPDIPLTMRVDVYYSRPAGSDIYDADNAAVALKPYIDGIFKHLGVDDGMVEEITVRRHRLPIGSERMVFTIRADA